MDLDSIIDETKWVGKQAAPSNPGYRGTPRIVAPGTGQEWLEKEVNHRTPGGDVRKVKVKSLPPEEQRKFHEAVEEETRKIEQMQPDELNKYNRK